MRIKEILSKYRRDFKAIYECEHCGDIITKPGYDDSYFHAQVIPKMICSKCGKTANESYRPLMTKYPDNQVI